MMTTTKVNDDNSDSDDSDIEFSKIDMSGVNFDDDDDDDVAPVAAAAAPVVVVVVVAEVDTAIQTAIHQLEHGLLFEHAVPILSANHDDVSAQTLEWTNLIRTGQYIPLLRQAQLPSPITTGDDDDNSMLVDLIMAYTKSSSSTTVEELFQLELVGIAALQLFLQVNYTGPSLEQVAVLSGERKEEDEDDFMDIIKPYLSGEIDDSIELSRKFHNKVLGELSVDGDWPCQVCQLPYWLLVGRTLLNHVGFPGQATWKTPSFGTAAAGTTSKIIETTTSLLPASRVWSLRAAVCHSRLFMVDEPSPTLWHEIFTGFRNVLKHYCLSLTTTTENNDSTTTSSQQHQEAASVVLEWGLAQHHMERPGKGRVSFLQALSYSGLTVELTGAIGKRTKFQQVATAQLQVKASSRIENTTTTIEEPSIAMKHTEDGLLLEKVRYEDDKDNETTRLSILDQTILLALCLDVKNTNPESDVLTGEEMGAYLSRVLQEQSDWMVYATALLERAWLEFASSHSKERSILQLQALMDQQNSNRLTLTQSTFSSIQEDSAPPQDRLRHLHKIVYPPRWGMLRDLADRYAQLGIVTSAAELFLEIELWDSVVECYARAGKESLAQEIVEARLLEEETPRMWAAYGDLKKDPQYYHKAIELSGGRFSAAFISLGKYYFEQGSLQEASGYYRKALTLRPLTPHAWFRLGAISMQLKDWSTALEAFSNVVQQEPAESDAWANVAAVHMQRHNPEEAYPALKESLKYQRTNWRVWTSQLYTCIDLEKYDEAVQACVVLLDLQQSKSNVPALEEKCVKAIVGKTLTLDRSQDSTKRTLSRLHALLDRISTQSASEAWIWETLAIFHQEVGLDEQVLENLLKEYRALQSIDSWEKDAHQVKKVVAVVSQISHFYLTQEATKESITKCRFLVKGVLQKIKAVHVVMDDSRLPTTELERLETILAQAIAAGQEMKSNNKVED
jgi:tetratricopeptide (TPR) repeat protein